jgi:hypothetical protein
MDDKLLLHAIASEYHGLTREDLNPTEQAVCDKLVKYGVLRINILEEEDRIVGEEFLTTKVTINNED